MDCNPKMTGAYWEISSNFIAKGFHALLAFGAKWTF